MTVTIQSITRSLWLGLIPYVVLWWLLLWRVVEWPSSGLPLGPGLVFPRHSWELILALEASPVLALLPGVWRFKAAHFVIGVAILLTMSNDLMFFAQTLMRDWTLSIFVTSVVSVAKAGFDVWVFGRVNERWDLYRSTQASSPAGG